MSVRKTMHPTMRAPWWAVWLLPCLPACTGLEHATVEKPLFAGYAVKWTAPPEEEAAEALRELEGVVTPVPNNSLLGMRPTVALHNMVREPERPKGLRNLLKYKIGSPPVYLHDVPLDDVDRALVNRMQNRGHFSAASSYSVRHKGRTARVTWTVAPGPVHRIADVQYGDNTAAGLDSALADPGRGAAIGPGMPYHLGRLTEERERMADRLRERGWYRLRADDLVWQADTAGGRHAVHLHLRVKPATTPEKRMRYTVGRVTVHGDHDALLPPSDTTVVDSVTYVNHLNMYRPRTITRGVFIQPGRTYSQRRSEATRSYLASYGVFRSVSVQYTDDSTRAGTIDADVLLAPQERFSLFSELNAISKSNNFTGPGLKAGFRDRDVFRGAEQLTVDVSTRFETQVAGPAKGTHAYEISAKAGLRIPRMVLLPFLRTARQHAPATTFDLGYGLFRRVGLYGLESANAGMGYLWRGDRRTWHDLRVLEVSYNSLYYRSPEFEQFLVDNPTMRRSFEEQFIIGLGYTYTHSTRRRTDQRHWATYTLGADEGGHLVSAVSQALFGARPAEGHTIFGQRFAQYVRFRPELRTYHAVGRRGAQVVTRLLVHAAYAHGNSVTVPYVKQFFAGGTNSLRGFRARSVGPGSYTGSTATDLLIDQVGDLKLEANLEYRFTFSGIIKGALFADAGNVWLWHDDPQRPGGQWHRDRMWEEIAVDAGLGLRIDPEVIVVRLDLAAPLHRPDLPAGQRWAFGSTAYRWHRNVILNIAIGYPF
jgi:outer membrane translocation and assembly module TamA